MSIVSMDRVIVSWVESIEITWLIYFSHKFFALVFTQFWYIFLHSLRLLFLSVECNLNWLNIILCQLRKNWTFFQRSQIIWFLFLYLWKMSKCTLSSWLTTFHCKLTFLLTEWCFVILCKLNYFNFTWDLSVNFIWGRWDFCLLPIFPKSCLLAYLDTLS